MITRECDVETVADFARYYASSFVGWHGREPDKIVPALIGRLDGTRIQVKFYTLQKDGTFAPSNWELHSFDSIKEYIDFGRPRLGILEDGPTIVFLSQTTPREPRKGLRIREARTYEFNGWETRNILVKQNPYNERMDWIWKAFNPEHALFKPSFQKLNSGERIGVAVTQDVGMFTLPKIPYPLVAFKRWTVGHARTEELIVLQPQYGDYQQQLQKVTGVEVKVAS